MRAAFRQKGGPFCLAALLQHPTFVGNSSSMKKGMQLAAFSALMMVGFWAKAQDYVHQVFVLNEGWSDWQTGEVLVPPTIGVYNPALQVYEVVDTVESAGFISDAIIVEGALFIAADGQILKYDADSYALLASTEIVGVRQLAEHNGLIYATRGEVDESGMNLPLDTYLQWFHADDLTWAGELTTSNGPAFATEGLAWKGDKLYIGINNAFDWGNEVGFIGEWDVVTDTYVEYDLGEEGKNPNRLFVEDNQVVTVNNRDYGSSSLSALNANGEAETHVVADATAGCLAAAVHDGELKYQITGEGAVRVSALDNLANSTAWIEEAPAYYGVAIDPISGNWYGSVTDYSTYGLVEIRDQEGALLQSFGCGVSPGVICMDVRNASNIAILSQPAVPSSQTIDILGRALPGVRGMNGIYLDEQGRKRLEWGW